MIEMISSLILLSLISILFGILIFLQPEIVAYLVASFFIVSGIIGLIASYHSKKLWSNLNK